MNEEQDAWQRWAAMLPGRDYPAPQSLPVSEPQVLQPMPPEMLPQRPLRDVVGTDTAPMLRQVLRNQHMLLCLTAYGPNADLLVKTEDLLSATEDLLGGNP